MPHARTLQKAPLLAVPCPGLFAMATLWAGEEGDSTHSNPLRGGGAFLWQGGHPVGDRSTAVMG